MSHEFRGPLVVGLRSQRISGEGVQGGNTDWSLWNPNVSMEWRRFGIGGGWVTSSSNRKLADVDLVAASGHVRIGDPRHLTFSFRLMEGEPYFSSGGAFEARLSTQVGSRIRPWIGLGGAEPFDDVGFLVGAEARVAPGWNLGVGGRLGQSEGLDENAIRAGLSYTWTHRRYFAPGNPLPDSTLPSR